MTYTHAVDFCNSYISCGKFFRKFVFRFFVCAMGVSVQQSLHMLCYVDAKTHSLFFTYLSRRGWLFYIRDLRREIMNTIGIVIIGVVLGLFFLDLNNTLAESAAKLGMHARARTPTRTCIHVMYIKIK